MKRELGKHLWLALCGALALAGCDDGGEEAEGSPDRGLPRPGGADSGVGGNSGGMIPIGGMGGEPVGGAPMGGEPMGGEPVGGEPVGGEPVGGAPVGGEPVGGMPVGGEPVGGEPVGGEPVGGMPIGGEPVGGMPMGGEGGQMGGAGGAPVGGDPCAGRVGDIFGACEASISEIRGGVALETLVTVEGEVTGLRSNNDGAVTNVAIQTPGADGVGVGLWVYLGDAEPCDAGCELASAGVGDLVAVTGVSGEFRTQRQLAQVLNLSVAQARNNSVLPRPAALPEVAAGGVEDGLEGMLLRVEGATVAAVSAEAGNFTLANPEGAELLVDDFLLSFPALPLEGQALPRVDGILRVTERDGERLFSLNPRLPFDFDLGDLSARASAPATVNVGDAFEVEVRLNQPAPEATTFEIAVIPFQAFAEPYPETVTISAGEVSASVGFTAAQVGEATVSFTVDVDLRTEATLEIVEQGPAPALVINEIDYDQPGADDGEFLEVYNPSGAAVPLAGLTVETVNGNGGAVYNIFDLSAAGASLPAGGYLVIGVPAVIGALPEGVMTIEASANFLQNGAPDGARIVQGGERVDGVAYEGEMAGVGEGDSLAGENGADSYSRCADGVDTGDNAADFALTAPTPGVANACD